MFVDPAEELKKKKDMEKQLKKKDAPILKFAGNISVQGAPGLSFGAEKQPQNSRALLIQGLKNQTLQKKSKNFTLDRLK